MTRERVQMKKFLVMVLAAMLICGGIVSVSAEETEQFRYRILDDGTAAISQAKLTIGDVVIPEEIDGHKVTSIDDWVFASCTDLTNVTLPDCMTTIGEYAFIYCSNLESINIPDSLVSIGSGAFSGCEKLSNVRISPNHPVFSFESDALINKTDMTLTSYLGYNSIAYEIPAGVRQIGSLAFDNTKLTSLIVPDSVTSTEYKAFSGMYDLEEIILPESLTSIGAMTFYADHNLTSLRIPAGVTEIGYGSFGQCGKLNTIDIDPENPVYEMRGSMLINTKENMLCFHLDQDSGSFEIPEGFKTIEANAFEASNKLQEIIVPDSVETIGEGAFMFCRNLTSVKLPKHLKTIERYTFYSCPALLSVTIPDDVDSIKEKAFLNCKNLNEVIIPASVTAIDEDVFYASKNVVCKIAENSYARQFCKEHEIKYIITIPGDEPLQYEIQSDNTIQITRADRALTECVIPAEIDGHKVTSIGLSAFAGCELLTKVTIPETVIVIGVHAFRYCSSLKTINIPDSVMFIVDGAFSSCTSLSNIDISPNHPVYAFTNGALINKESMTLIQYTDQQSESYEISSGITKIGVSAFENAKLTSVIIPDSVTSIENYAFRDMKNLKAVTIPDGVTRIGFQAFYGNENMADVSLPASVTELGHDIFGWCLRLRAIDIDPDNPVYEMRGNMLLNKKENSLYYHPNLNEGTFIIPEEIEIIDAYAFVDNVWLNEIIIPDTVKEIKDHAFYSCNRLSSVRLPNGLKAIDDYTFTGCRNLKSVSIPDGVQSIGCNVFDGCYYIEEVTIPASVTYIDPTAFTQCQTLVCKVVEGSYAQQFCEENGIKYEIQ